MKIKLLFISLFCVAQLSSQVITTPPNFSNLRAMAEWEEVDALTIAWTGFPAILKQIVAAGILETHVIILSDDVTGTNDYLTATNEGGPAITNLDNITILPASYNTIWLRDYAANPVYANEVDSLILVDWIYNRDRPLDDNSCEVIASHLNLPIYRTSVAPYDLMNTGGNYMSDGFGTAFASHLITDENDGTGNYNLNYPTHTEAEIDGIMNAFMGINTYIKMQTLPYDGIHHIDMHMKLVDEETLLVSEYPDGVADGPQINANIQYVLSNYNSIYGTPYRIINIPAPPSTAGNYPDSNGAYRTYSNAIFVNGSVLFPTYREEYDTIAYRIWGEACPGYNLVGIDCDNTGNNIIAQSGAIHCITHTVGVQDPLLIRHQPLPDTYYNPNPFYVSAYARHRSGVAQMKLYWRLQGETAFNEVLMSTVVQDYWECQIPSQPAGSTVEYYIHGTSNSGKEQVRPIVAPDGFWSFNIIGAVNVQEQFNTSSIARIYPNPAQAITCIEVNHQMPCSVNITLNDLTGRTVQHIFSGPVGKGVQRCFIDAAQLPSGSYFVTISSENSLHSEPLIIR